MNIKTVLMDIIKSLAPEGFKKFIRLNGKKWRRRKLIRGEQKKVKITKKQLLEGHIDTLEKYKGSRTTEEISGDYVIWVMWWQGEEEMPSIIKMNYESLKRNANGHKINLITNENYFNYLELPDYIVSKVKRKIISITHLSDIIRVALLSVYGGLWLDATVYVASSLPAEIRMNYWTTKWNLNHCESNMYPLWLGLWDVSSVPRLTITQYMGIWFSQKNNPIFDCLKDFWFSYWKNEADTPYYWTTEVFLIGVMYDALPVVKKLIDEVGLSNPNIFKMRHHMNKEYKQEIADQLLQDTHFFYLSWKETYQENDHETGKRTLYSMLKEEQLDFKRL